MRPVNLIPKEDRRGAGAGGRNLVSYGIIGLLIVILGAVSLLAIFDKKTSERKVEISSLESQVNAAQAEATSLSSFISFKQIHDERVETIDSLAKSRFDWERVMRELAVVIPDEVWLTNLTGTATPAAQVTNGAGLSLRASIPGPALEMTGCALNQRTVARLIAAINDIDGVTRVLVSNSSKPEVSESTTESGTDEDAAVTTCAIRQSYPSFELVAAFDDVAAVDPAAVTTPDATAVPAGTTAPATTSAEPATTTPSTETPATTTEDGGVAETSDQNTQEQSDVAGAQQGAQDAAQIPAGGGN